MARLDLANCRKIFFLQILNQKQTLILNLEQDFNSEYVLIFYSGFNSQSWNLLQILNLEWKFGSRAALTEQNPEF